MKRKRRAQPVAVGAVLGDALRQAGIARRVEQAQVVLEWSQRVGPQIAAVTSARAATADGTLFVDVVSSAWMAELMMMQPTLLEAVNRGRGSGRIRQIRWRVGSLSERHSTG